MKWSKIIILCCVLSIISCRKVEVVPIPQVNLKVFNQTENTIVDGQSIYFDLPSTGIYMLTLIDKNSGQIISRERFTGNVGENIKKVYTKSLKVRYLYLVLEDDTKKEINKTSIIIN